MQIKDLLNEAPRVEPGSRNPMNLKVANINDQINKLEDIRYNVYNFAQRSHPDNKELQDLIDNWANDYSIAIDAEIEKVKQSANKDNINGVPRRLAKLLDGIVKNCSQIVAAYRQTDMFLYRGTRQDEDAFYGRPFQNRNPKDSNSKLDKLFNMAMAKAGFQARRDNSIFAGKYGHASGFGSKVYIVFPRDGFHFTWSDNTKDLVLSSEHLIKMFDMDKVKAIYSVIFDPEHPEIAQKFREFGGKMYEHTPNYIGTNDGFMGAYRLTDHLGAIAELVKQGIIDQKYAQYGDMEFYVDPATTIKSFGLHNTDIVAAIKQQHEVTINGDYYAIAAEHEAIIREYLGMSKKVSQSWD